MPGGKQGSRFEMLINVGVQGTANVSKFNSTAMKTKAVMKGLAEKFEKSGASMTEAKQTLALVRKELSGYTATYLKYEQQLKRINQLESRKTALTRAETTELKKLKNSVEATTQKLTNHKKVINQIIPGLIKFDANNKKNVGQLAKLQDILAKVTIGIAKMSKSAERNGKAQDKMSKSTKRSQVTQQQFGKAVKENEFAVDRLRQRIKNTGTGAFARLRRFAGALRNQLLLLTFATVGLRTAFRTTFTAANELEASLKGLGAVATNTGAGFKEAQNEALKLSENGLLTVQDAAAGLKNLLSAGFGLKEATALMNTLTDAAAFNRQGTLSMGQAIVGATQGIKNQNSIMVDNAGITKNLSIMYKEFADANNLTAGTLTEAQKRQAIFNGILKEGAVFAGNAAQVVDTMSGALTKLGTESTKASANVGKLIQPIAGAFVKALATGTEDLKNFTEGLLNTDGTMDKLNLMASKTEETVRKLGATFISFSVGVAKLLVTLAPLLAVLIKYSLVMKIIRGVQNKLILSTGFLAKELDNHRRVTFLASNQVEFYDKRTKSLASTSMVFRLELRRLNTELAVNQKAALKTAGAFNTLSGAFNRAKIFAIGLGKNLLNVGKALRVVGKRLMFAAGKFAGIILLMEFAFKVVQKLINKYTDFSYSTSQIAIENERMKTSTDSLNRSMAGLNQSFANTLEAARKFADSSDLTQALQAQQKMVEAYFNSIQRLRSDYMKSSSATDRAEIKTQIDEAKTGYEEALSNLKQTQTDIEKITRGHLDTLSKINTAHTKAKTEHYKNAGLKDVFEAKAALEELTKLEKAHGKVMKQVTTRSKLEVFVAERQLNQMRLDAEMQFQNAKKALVDKGYDAINKSNEKYLKQLINLNATEVERVKAKYKALRGVERTALERKVSDAQQNLRQLSQDQENALRTQMEAIGGFSDFPTIKSDAYGHQLPMSHQMGIGQMSTRTPEGLRDISAEPLGGVMAESIAGTFELIKGSQENLNKVLMDGKATVKTISNEVNTYSENLKSADHQLGTYINSLEGNNKQETLLYGNMLKAREIVKSKIKAVDGVKISTVNYNKETAKQSAELKNLQGQLDNTVTLQDQVLKSQERAEIAAILYRDALKSQAIALREIESTFNNSLGKLDGYTSKIEIQIRTMRRSNAANLQNRTEMGRMVQTLQSTENGYAKVGTVIGAFGKDLLRTLNPLAQSEELLNKNALAQEQLAIKQQNKMALLQNDIDMNLAKQRSEENLLKTMEDSGNYTKVELEKQQMRINASRQKVEALRLEQEGVAKLHAVEKEYAEDAAAIEAMQDRIAQMTSYAQSFSNFITKIQNQEHKRQMEHQKYQHGLTKEVEKGNIERETMQKLTVEHAKLMAAKEKLDQAKFTADLVREIGKQIMLYAAKKAAASGNIIAAGAMLVAGVAGMAIANNAANKIEMAAQDKYNQAERDFEAAEAEIRAADPNAQTDDPGSATGSQKFGGSIKAENLAVTISPTVVISGEQVFIGQGSVQEFGAEMQALLLDSMNDAIENREIDLSNAANQGG